tara:strand:- start:101 stop:1048 length:948 start_codon:yes stop_codon:yes gene_type:complete
MFKLVLILILIILSGCIQIDSNLEDRLVERQIKDAEEFMVENSDWDNSGVLYHILYVIYDYEQIYGSKYDKEKEEFIEKLVLILEKDQELLVKINSLDILSRFKYDKEFLNKLAKEIIKEQKGDGSWDESKEGYLSAPVFITFRTVIALNSHGKYEENIEKGLIFLNNSYRDFKYNDSYLKYIYPDEKLNCKVENCELTYRVMDAYFNVYFIKKEFANYSIIQKQVDDVDIIFNNIIDEWRMGEIYNARKSTQEGFALDTYCIFAYVMEDEKMDNVILDYLDYTDYRWSVESDTIGKDYWRFIADETWCARAIIK